MSEVKFNLVKVGDVQNITLFYDGEMYVASNDHPNWTKIIELAEKYDPEVANLFDIPKMVKIQLKELSERITIKNDEFLLDGDPMHNGLTTKVIDFLTEGLPDWKPLVAFLEKALSNPSKESQEQLFDWLDNNRFAITDDGNVIGYKGVIRKGEGYTSWHAGTASVNGVEQKNQKIEQNIGDIVTMPRSAVNPSRDVGCSTGLHICTFDYAKGYGDSTVRVLVNPRDFVSVPRDGGFKKARACRYKVDAEVDRNNQPVTTAVGKTDSVLPESVSPVATTFTVTSTDSGYTYTLKTDDYEEDYFPGVGTWVDAP